MREVNVLVGIIAMLGIGWPVVAAEPLHLDGTTPGLVAQSFQFGRYLLIAGSRPGTQPLNLQGKWNESIGPPWGSKWTLNCNVEISPRTGQIQEWAEDWDPDSVGTGQLAPLWALYPGNQITPWGTPDLATAAKNTMLARRMAFGSWCSAMRVNYAARLGDGKLFTEMLQNHMRGHIMPSLLSNFGRALFQIDGNQGVTAGIAEALLQSHAGMLNLLPALPKSWPTGSVEGLRARGGFEVDIAWNDGRLATATIRSTGGKDPEVHYGRQTAKLRLNAGQSAVLKPDLSVR